MTIPLKKALGLLPENRRSLAVSFLHEQQGRVDWEQTVDRPMLAMLLLAGAIETTTSGFMSLIEQQAALRQIAPKILKSVASRLAELEIERPAAALILGVVISTDGRVGMSEYDTVLDIMTGEPSNKEHPAASVCLDVMLLLRDGIRQLSAGS